MHILIVSVAFPPEPVTSAVTSEQLAIALVRSGHEVTVISGFPSRPGGKLYSGYKRSWRMQEKTKDGYTLIRVFSSISSRSTLWSRLRENLSFGVGSAVTGLSVNPDVIYANTWPIFASGLLTAISSLRKIPLILNIQDIYPEAVIGLGMIPSRGLISKILKRIDGMVARRSAALVTISQSFADFYRVARKVPDEKIHLVHNWMDENEIQPGPRNGAFRQERGIAREAFIVLYAGNVGINACVESVVRAAVELQDMTGVLFLILGDGSYRAACEELSRRHGLSNMRFLHPIRREDLPVAQAAADLLILPTCRSGALTSMPSKLVSYMLSGRPVVAGVDAGSDTARTIRDAQCGIIVEPEEPKAIASAIRRLRQQPDQLRTMGTRGRSYAEKHFSRKVCVPEMIRIIESVGDQRINFR